MKDYVLILSSGGIDSTACINFYKKINFNIECLFLDFGQQATARELKAIKRICAFYNIKLRTLKISTERKYKSGEVIGRNAFFIFTALMNFENENGIIALGLHKGTPYYDCSAEFVNEIQKIIDNYSKGTIKISTPFIEFNKMEIYDYCISEKIPLNFTYSCELGKVQPCGECATCKDLIEIYDSKK